MYIPSVLETPRGTYTIVGTVPMNLAYRMADGSPLDDDMIRSVKQVGPGLLQDLVR